MRNGTKSLNWGQNPGADDQNFCRSTECNWRLRQWWLGEEWQLEYEICINFFSYYYYHVKQYQSRFYFQCCHPVMPVSATFSMQALFEFVIHQPSNQLLLFLQLFYITTLYFHCFCLLDSGCFLFLKSSSFRVPWCCRYLSLWVGKSLRYHLCHCYICSFLTAQ